MDRVATLSFREARLSVLERVRAGRRTPPVVETDLASAAGRVLAADIPADRDYPPLARSIRDGFAVRAIDLPGTLRIAGEVRAGSRYEGAVGPGEAVEIMTGAPVPPGADAVVMIEYATREDGRVRIDRAAEPHQFIVARASEARAGETLLRAGTRLDYSAIAVAAAVGRSVLPVYALPRVAIIATGDEIVDVSAVPLDFQVRNSNVYSLAAQVRRAGGLPEPLPVAPDEIHATRTLVERGLDTDLLLLSGGVSAGKYDLVERALADAGAEFFFDRVLIQPGQPLVFGSARGTFFFGLPGNPASTMLTFEVFARAAVELAGGQEESVLPMPLARLTEEFHHKVGLTRFLPARLAPDGAEVTPVPWHGSGDMPALARANAYLVADAERAAWARGDLIPVLAK